MSDTSYPVFQHYGTDAERLAFTPTPGGGQPIYIWYETDTGFTWLFDTSWHQIASADAAAILTDTQANIPAAATTAASSLFFPSDGFSVQRNTGSAWEPWGPLFPFIPPVSGDFAWINQGGASVSTTNGGIYLSGPASTVNLRIRKKAAPSTPYTVTGAFIPQLIGMDFQQCGLLFRESGSGKIATFNLGASGSTTTSSFIGAQKWTNATTFSANYQLRIFDWGQIVFLRITDDGVDRICSYSNDGQNFIQFHSVGRTDFLTADEVGFYVNEETNAYAVGMTLLSWVEA